MSPSIGHISVQLPRTGRYEVRPYSDHLTRLIDQVSYVLNVCPIVEQVETVLSSLLYVMPTLCVSLCFCHTMSISCENCNQ